MTLIHLSPTDSPASANSRESHDVSGQTDAARDPRCGDLETLRALLLRLLTELRAE